MQEGYESLGKNEVYEHHVVELRGSVWLEQIRVFFCQVVQRGLDEAHGDLSSVWSLALAFASVHGHFVGPRMISVQCTVLIAPSFDGSEIVRRQVSADCHRVCHELFVVPG